MKENLCEKLIKVVPSKRQIEWQTLEFTAFFHFGINTFTEQEWGHGDEDISIFNPKLLDAKQWVKSIKKAGIKGALLTCKHHDGFCLWPSKYSDYTIANTPYKNGKGDIVKEVADACREYGIKFGIYLSPWDMNAKSYGTPQYNDFYVNQLKELLTNYGDIYCVWWDGACGEGENGKKQIYDFDRYIKVVRELQPNACTSVCGIDVRWCGNEAGHCRKSEWSVVSKRLTDTEKIQEDSQQKDNKEFRERKIASTDQDLGSQKALENEPELIWYPSEVDTSIRPGWFYHKNEDAKVKSLDHLLDIYYNSVGGNSVLLLNIPPNKDGLIEQVDISRLEQIGQYLKNAFKYNICENSKISVDSFENDLDIKNVLKNNDDYWKTKDNNEQAEITIKFDKVENIKNIVLQEQIQLSQRIEEFEILALINNVFEVIYNGTTVGYKKICKVDNIETDLVKIKITKSRVSPTLKFIGIYN